MDPADDHVAHAIGNRRHPLVETTRRDGFRIGNFQVDSDITVPIR